MAPPPAAVRPRGPWQRFASGGWYFLIVILSLGLLTAVPFGHAATRLRKPALWAWPAM